MTMFAPGGEIRQAVLLPFTWSNQAQSPSQSGDEHVTVWGKFKQTMKEDYLKLENDQASIELTTSNITITASKIVLKGDVHLGDDGGVFGRFRGGERDDLARLSLGRSAGERLVLGVDANDLLVAFGRLGGQLRDGREQRNWVFAGGRQRVHGRHRITCVTTRPAQLTRPVATISRISETLDFRRIYAP